MSRAARIAPRMEGEGYLAYLDKVDAALHERAHNFTAYLDQIQQERGRKEGTEQLMKMKKAHHNMAIEDLVMGTGGRHLYKEANHRIYSDRASLVIGA